MTDHENLAYLNMPKSSKVPHWKLAIQEYDFSVSHVAGPTNVVADCFSRLLTDEEMDGLLENMCYDGRRSYSTGQIRFDPSCA